MDIRASFSIGLLIGLVVDRGERERDLDQHDHRENCDGHHDVRDEQYDEREVPQDLERVDAIACDGHGVCAELFREWIRLDDWGYPIVSDAPIPDELIAHARRAVNACPKVALRLESLLSLRR